MIGYGVVMISQQVDGMLSLVVVVQETMVLILVIILLLDMTRFLLVVANFYRAIAIGRGKIKIQQMTK